MARNPYVGTAIVGSQFTSLMREINRIEATLTIPSTTTGGQKDVMVVYDHSASMADLLPSVKDQVMRVFQSVCSATSGVHLGTVQMGVDGTTADETYIRKSRILDYPTWDAQHYRWVLDYQIPSPQGTQVWFLNSIELAAQTTAWRSWVRKEILVIADERADQYQDGSSHFVSTSRMNAAIQLCKSLGVAVSFICPRVSSSSRCAESFTAVSSQTGGFTLVAPSDSAIISALSVSGSARTPYPQTTWQRFDTGRQSYSVGTSDGGVSVPPLSALDGTKWYLEYIIAMRQAVERIVSHGELRAPSGQFFNLTAGSADNLLSIAMGNGSAYGTLPARGTWRRTAGQLKGSRLFDIDIGEICEAVRVLKTSAGLEGK